MTDLPEHLAKQVEAHTGHRWWNAGAAIGFKMGTPPHIRPLIDRLADKGKLPPDLIAEVQNHTGAPWWVGSDEFNKAMREAQ